MSILDDTFNKARAISTLHLPRVKPKDLEKQLTEFTTIAHYQPFGTAINWENNWVRGRRLLPSGEPFKRLDELIYPKTPSGQYGRANYKDQCVFYASGTIDTVLAELAPEPGERIQLIVCRVCADSTDPSTGEPLAVPSVILGEYESFYHASRSQLNNKELVKRASEFFESERQYAFSIPLYTDVALATLYADSFLAYLFRQQQVKWSDYKITSAFANLIFQGAGAMLYPSVQSNGGINIAAPAAIFDHYFEVLETALVDVQDTYGHNVYKYAICDSTTVFTTDGEIHWGKKAKLSIVQDESGRRMADPKHVGWRGPKSAEERPVPKFV